MFQTTMGLRLKFNLVLLTIVTGGLSVMVWADYRHEYMTLMEAHAVHISPIGAIASAGPVDPWTLPLSAARRSLVMHMTYGIAVLALFVVGTNVTVHCLILRPVRQMRERIALLHRGQWRGPVELRGGDEIAVLEDGFQTLGPELDALVGHALRTDRLATVALVSKRLEADLDPEVHRIGAIAARLMSRGRAEDRSDGEVLARAAAGILQAVHQYDPAFTHVTKSRPAKGA